MPVTINGSAGVTTNSGAVYNGIQAGTSVSASGTSVDFTNIPSWVKRITVMFNGVSTNGSSNLLIQIGSGSFSTSGYTSFSATTSNGTGSSTAGFLLTSAVLAADTDYGSAILTLVTGNSWINTSNIQRGSLSQSNFGGGGISLGGALDRVRITTVNGTDTFDAGTINILYE